jgi:hypothetical protein
MRVRDEALVVGTAAWRLALGAADRSLGIMPDPGGPDAAGGGVGPPVGGPFCAIASEVPPTSSAMIARLFTVVIVTSNA